MINDTVNNKNKTYMMSTNFHNEFTNYEHNVLSRLSIEILICIECKKKGNEQYCYIECKKKQT